MHCTGKQACMDCSEVMCLIPSLQAWESPAQVGCEGGTLAHSIHTRLWTGVHCRGRHITHRKHIVNALCLQALAYADKACIVCAHATNNSNSACLMPHHAYTCTNVTAMSLPWTAAGDNMTKSWLLKVTYAAITKSFWQEHLAPAFAGILTASTSGRTSCSA